MIVAAASLRALGTAFRLAHRSRASLPMQGVASDDEPLIGLSRWIEIPEAIAMSTGK